MFSNIEKVLHFTYFGIWFMQFMKILIFEFLRWILEKKWILNLAEFAFTRPSRLTPPSLFSAAYCRVISKHISRFTLLKVLAFSRMKWLQKINKIEKRLEIYFIPLVLLCVRVRSCIKKRFSAPFYFVKSLKISSITRSFGSVISSQQNGG